MVQAETGCPWVSPTTGFWQTLEPLADWEGRWAPPWRYGLPVRVPTEPAATGEAVQEEVVQKDPAQTLRLPIRLLPGGGDRAVASLIANQASLAVADALALAMGELARPFAADVIVGLPTLGLVFAPGVARALGHARWVPLGYSRKFWYDEALSTAVESITTPGPGKRLYLDPNQRLLVQARTVLLVDDAVSSGRTLRRIWDLLDSLGAIVIGAVVAMCQGDSWRAELGAERAGRVRGVFASPLLQLGSDGWWPLGTPSSTPPDDPANRA